MTKSISFLMILFIVLMSGCNDTSDELNIDYSQLEKSSLKGTPLSPQTNVALDNYIKNGIRLRLTQQDYPYALAATSPTSEGDSANSVGTSRFSTTNVHEIGVDEADRLKYDGEYLYQVNQSGYEDDGSMSANSVRILRTDPENATAEQVAEILNDSESLNISDIFLRPDSDQLVMVKNTQYFYWNAFLADSDWSWSSGKTEIQLFDVETPSNPREEWKIEIEGNLEGSRRINNVLYLVTRYIPNVADINYAATSDEEKLDNESLIANTHLSDLLPHYQTNDGTIQSLVTPQDCFVAEETGANEGYADVLTLSAIDLENQQVTASICLNANVTGIYSSESGFYIGGSSYNFWENFSSYSVFHKFSLNGTSIEYKASSTVPGYLGWDDPSFRMSEFNGDLRVVTTKQDEITGGPVHQLTILRENSERELSIVATLPNEDNPAPLGKPGESIYAVRFSQERAYIVTFEQVDPLYVLDLSNHETPRIAGELEIPGFSRYLHPLSNDWLLGIGNEVVNGLQQGIKVELYDISDMSAPSVGDKLVFGNRGTSSEALYDLRSISLLSINEQQLRLAFPIDIWENSASSSFGEWLESGLYLFELDTEESGEMTLEFSGKMITESVNPIQSYPFNSGLGRSKLHDDAVFFLYGNHFYASLWDSLEQVNGPF